MFDFIDIQETPLVQLEEISTRENANEKVTITFLNQ